MYPAKLPGYKDADPDYHLTRTATLFSAVCAVSETLGPMLVLSNNSAVVTFGIFFIFCMHLYIISTLIVDAEPQDLCSGLHMGISCTEHLRSLPGISLMRFCTAFSSVATGPRWAPWLTSLVPTYPPRTMGLLSVFLPGRPFE